MYNFWVGTGNCFAKNKLPGCFNLREDQGTVFFIKGILFFHTTSTWLLWYPRAWWGPPDPGLGARASVLGLLSCYCQRLETGGAHWAVDIPTSTPCTLMAHHQGVFISMEKGLQEALVAMAPNLGAPRWAICSWGHLGGRGTRPHQPILFFPSSGMFPLSPKGISCFWKHSVGDILVTMQYFYVMWCSFLTWLWLLCPNSPQSYPKPTPFLFSGTPVPGLGPEWLENGGWGGVPAIVHSKNLWALKANFLLKFLYSLKLFY